MTASPTDPRSGNNSTHMAKMGVEELTPLLLLLLVIKTDDMRIVCTCGDVVFGDDDRMRSIDDILDSTRRRVADGVDTRVASDGTVPTRHETADDEKYPLMRRVSEPSASDDGGDSLELTPKEKLLTGLQYSATTTTTTTTNTTTPTAATTATKSNIVAAAAAADENTEVILSSSSSHGKERRRQSTDVGARRSRSRSWTASKLCQLLSCASKSNSTDVDDSRPRPTRKSPAVTSPTKPEVEIWRLNGRTLSSVVRRAMSVADGDTAAGRSGNDQTGDRKSAVQNNCHVTSAELEPHPVDTAGVTSGLPSTDNRILITGSSISGERTCADDRRRPVAGFQSPPPEHGDSDGEFRPLSMRPDYAELDLQYYGGNSATTRGEISDVIVQDSGRSLAGNNQSGKPQLDSVMCDTERRNCRDLGSPSPETTPNGGPRKPAAGNDVISRLGRTRDTSKPEIAASEVTGTKLSSEERSLCEATERTDRFRSLADDEKWARAGEKTREGAWRDVDSEMTRSLGVLRPPRKTWTSCSDELMMPDSERGGRRLSARNVVRGGSEHCASSVTCRHIVRPRHGSVRETVDNTRRHTSPSPIRRTTFTKHCSLVVWTTHEELTLVQRQHDDSDNYRCSVANTTNSSLTETPPVHQNVHADMTTTCVSADVLPSSTTGTTAETERGDIASDDHRSGHHYSAPSTTGNKVPAGVDFPEVEPSSAEQLQLVQTDSLPQQAPVHAVAPSSSTSSGLGRAERGKATHDELTLVQRRQAGKDRCSVADVSSTTVVSDGLDTGTNRSLTQMSPVSQTVHADTTTTRVSTDILPSSTTTTTAETQRRHVASDDHVSRHHSSAESTTSDEVPVGIYFPEVEPSSVEQLKHVETDSSPLLALRHAADPSSSTSSGPGTGTERGKIAGDDASSSQLAPDLDLPIPSLRKIATYAQDEVLAGTDFSEVEASSAEQRQLVETDSLPHQASTHAADPSPRTSPGLGTGAERGNTDVNLPVPSSINYSSADTLPSSPTSGATGETERRHIVWEDHLSGHHSSAASTTGNNVPAGIDLPQVEASSAEQLQLVQTDSLPQQAPVHAVTPSSSTSSGLGRVERGNVTDEELTVVQRRQADSNKDRCSVADVLSTTVVSGGLEIGTNSSLTQTSPVNQTVHKDTTTTRVSTDILPSSTTTTTTAETKQLYIASDGHHSSVASTSSDEVPARMDFPEVEASSVEPLKLAETNSSPQQAPILAVAQPSSTSSGLGRAERYNATRDELTLVERRQADSDKDRCSVADVLSTTVVFEGLETDTGSSLIQMSPVNETVHTDAMTSCVSTGILPSTTTSATAETERHDIASDDHLSGHHSSAASTTGDEVPAGIDFPGVEASFLDQLKLVETDSSPRQASTYAADPSPRTSPGPAGINFPQVKASSAEQLQLVQTDSLPQQAPVHAVAPSSSTSSEICRPEHGNATHDELTVVQRRQDDKDRCSVADVSSTTVVSESLEADTNSSLTQTLPVNKNIRTDTTATRVSTDISQSSTISITAETERRHIASDDHLSGHQCSTASVSYTHLTLPTNREV